MRFKNHEYIYNITNFYFKFILEKIGLRVRCVWKNPFEDKPEYLDFAPISQEYRNKSSK